MNRFVNVFYNPHLDGERAVGASGPFESEYLARTHAAYNPLGAEFEVVALIIDAVDAEEADDLEPLTEREVNTLATYNTERSRGILHNPEWRDRMAELQARYDHEQEEPRG